MKHLSVAALLLLLMTGSLFAQTGKTLPEGALHLPEGVIVVAGQLKPKAGYRFQIAADGKSATLINSKGVGTGGTFSCDCGNPKPTGACSVVILNGGLNCVGNCSCQLVTIITSVKYSVDLSGGILRKSER